MRFIVLLVMLLFFCCFRLGAALVQEVEPPIRKQSRKLKNSKGNNNRRPRIPSTLFADVSDGIDGKNGSSSYCVLLLLLLLRLSSCDAI
jgi:hypothetical protein